LFDTDLAEKLVDWDVLNVRIGDIVLTVYTIVSFAVVLRIV